MTKKIIEIEEQWQAEECEPQSPGEFNSIHGLATVEITETKNWGTDADGNRGRVVYDYEIVKLEMDASGSTSGAPLDYSYEEHDYFMELILNKVQNVINNWEDY